MKKISKISYLFVILMFVLFTGFACSLATANENNQSSTKLDFEATEVQTIWAPYEMWGQGAVVHMRVYKQSYTYGTIDGIEFTGYNELDLHVIMHPDTLDYVTIGELTMYIEWNGLVGTFYGSIAAKGTAMFGPLDGKYALQGTEDFEGMKLFGIVWDIDPYWGINGLSGTILIPN